MHTAYRLIQSVTDKRTMDGPSGQISWIPWLTIRGFARPIQFLVGKKTNLTLQNDLVLQTCGHGETSRSTFLNGGIYRRRHHH